MVLDLFPFVIRHVPTCTVGGGCLNITGWLRRRVGTTDRLPKRCDEHFHRWATSANVDDVEWLLGSHADTMAVLPETATAG